MSQSKLVLNVNGMACSHCEHAVKTAVGALDGVANVAVDLKGKKVTTRYNPDRVNPDQIRNAIEDQGYDVV
ncbi:MAG: copper chaperone CopZ [Oscillospiraceae bacterium]|jgi:copper chaperone|nr:copper chaperone CopZ [Oscillospiraceae bacterium]